MSRKKHRGEGRGRAAPPGNGANHAPAPAPSEDALRPSAARDDPSSHPSDPPSHENDLERGSETSEERSSLSPRRDVAEISAYVPSSVDFVMGEGDPLDAPSFAERREPLGDVADELRAVEAEVDRIFWEQSRRRDDGPLKNVVDRIREAIPVDLPGQDGSIVDAAKDVVSPDYYLRQWGKIGLRNRSEEVDEFGLDPVYEKRLRPVIDALYKHYFRVEVCGIENVPPEGRCILVANHSGVLPYDGIMLRAAMRLEHPSHRELRWLAEDFIFHLPFLGAFMNRIGAVRACQENAERLLRQEHAVCVFPEGIKGIGKLYKERYRLQRFGRGGFIKLALRTQSPIVPVSIVGAEESAPMLYRVEYLTQLFGLPFVPVTPTFPWLGPLGLIPAPTKWRIELGKPMHLEEHGAEAAEDALLVNRLSEKVRTEIQRTLDQRVAERKNVFLG